MSILQTYEGYWNTHLDGSALCIWTKYQAGTWKMHHGYWYSDSDHVILMKRVLSQKTENVVRQRHGSWQALQPTITLIKQIRKAHINKRKQGFIPRRTEDAIKNYK